MICKHIQKKLSTNEPLEAKDMQHLSKCQACLSFKADAQRLRRTIAIETPEALKNRAWSKSVHLLKFGETAPKRRFARSPLSSLLIGLAVLVAFILVGLFVLNVYCAESNLACRLLIGLLILIFLQNAITALFIPVFLQKKLNIYF